MKEAHEGNFLTSAKWESAFGLWTFWKEATSVFNFKKRQSGDCHWEANEALIPPNAVLDDIDEVMSIKKHKEEMAVNRKILTILQNIRFLARQGLPFRIPLCR